MCFQKGFYNHAFFSLLCIFYKKLVKKINKNLKESLNVLLFKAIAFFMRKRRDKEITKRLGNEVE